MFPFSQKQVRHQDAKTVEEKAAKIKEWVMLKLSEVKKTLQQDEKSSLVVPCLKRDQRTHWGGILMSQ